MLSTTSEHGAQPRAATSTLITLLAVAAGLCVSSIYYNQPLLPLIGSDLNADVHTLGLIPTFTQIGYALGIFLLIPLGDKFDRRTLFAVKSALLVLALAMCGVVTSDAVLVIMCLVMGISATVTQDIVPMASFVTAPAQQARAVGKVMTGLLLGILLSRVVSGVIGEAFGWRAMFELAAVVIAVFAIFLWRRLPAFESHSTLPYHALIGSMLALWQQHPALRKAALAQGLLSLSFSAFWSVLALMLKDDFELGSAVAGAFGLAGAMGAFAAFLSGSLIERFGAPKVAQAGAVLVTVSFALMLAMPLLPTTGQLAIVIITAIGFDFGVQGALVSHQNIIYNLDHQSRGRLNAILFTIVFIGMSLGSAMGVQAYAHFGWHGLTWLAIIAGAISVVVASVKVRGSGA